MSYMYMFCRSTHTHTVRMCLRCAYTKTQRHDMWISRCEWSVHRRVRIYVFSMHLVWFALASTEHNRCSSISPFVKFIAQKHRHIPFSHPLLAIWCSSYDAFYDSMHAWPQFLFMCVQALHSEQHSISIKCNLIKCLTLQWKYAWHSRAYAFLNVLHSDTCSMIVYVDVRTTEYT